MKNVLLIIGCLTIASAFAQNSKHVTMEKRARELHRVLGLNDKEQWKKFMKENYTKSMIDRPAKSNVETTKESSGSGGARTTTEQLEEKTKVFERLHSDFGKSKIVSLKPVNEKIDMILEDASGLKGNFTLMFENKSPYLIDGIRAEIEQR